MDAWIWIVIVVAAVLVVGVVSFALVRGRGSGTATLERPRSQVAPKPGVDYLPGVGDDAEVPRDGAKRTVTTTVDLPTTDAGTGGTGGLARATGVDLPTRDPVLDPVLDVPEPSAGRMQRLRARLARSQNSLGRGLLSVLSRDHLDEESWDEVEEALLTADVGLAATQEIVAALRTRVKVLGTRSTGELRALLADELVKAIDPSMDRVLHTAPHADHPGIVMMVGVNGTGKTTTCGKLARLLVADGRTVLLGAADTFRAAAADQLQTWGERVGADTVRGPEGGDPASVGFDTVKQGIERKVDTVLLDTAGRLHTKVGLMDELGKVKRVVEKQAPVDETLLVLDATTGQNGLMQARVFTEVVDVTGIVLTKLDGTAKGGIVISVQRELGVPVKLVGLGEGADDLAPFDPEAFVDALLGDAV